MKVQEMKQRLLAEGFVSAGMSTYGGFLFVRRARGEKDKLPETWDLRHKLALHWPSGFVRTDEPDKIIELED